jgi:Uma2 family endonuclease
MPLLTADDLYSLPDIPCELRRGVLHMMSPASGGHGAVVTRLLTVMGPYVHGKGLGALFTAETGFVLERDPDTVLCPDIAFVVAARLPAGGIGWSGFMELAPDLVVEVLSPSNRPAEVRAKIADYLRLGVRAVWALIPAKRAVRVHCREGSRITETLLTEADMLDGGEVLPGFRCPVAELFVDLRR